MTAGTLEMPGGDRTVSQLHAGVCSIVMCGWQVEEVAVSLCILQEATEAGHLTQATGRQTLLQMSCGSCRQAWSEGRCPYAACGTGWVMAGLSRLQAGSQVAQGVLQQGKRALGGLAALQARQTGRWHLTTQTVEAAMQGA